MLKESDCEYEDSYVASDENYIPSANFGTSTAKNSDIELEVIIKQEEEYNFEVSVEDELVFQRPIVSGYPKMKQNEVVIHYQAPKQYLKNKKFCTKVDYFLLGHKLSWATAHFVES